MLPNKTTSKTVCMLLDNPYIYDNRVKREAHSLIEAGWTVHIFATQDENSSLPHHETIDGVHVHRVIRTKYMRYRSLRDARYLFTLIRKILKHCPTFNVIHVHDARLLPYATLLKLVTGKKLIYDSHEYWEGWIRYKIEQSLDPYQNVGSEKTRCYIRKKWSTIQKLETKLIPQCDIVLSVSQSICDILQSRLNPSARTQKPTVLLRNVPYYTDMQAHASNSKLFHQRFNLPPETKVLLYQGGIEPTRGLERIVRALHKLQDLSICFIVMGPLVSPKYLDILQCYAPTGRFFYKEGEYSDQYLKWTASADAGIVSTLNIHESYYYSMPNKLFEYIQSELPVLNPNFPDSAKLVNDYNIGLNFDMDSINSIAGQIRTLLTDTQLYQHLKENVKQAKTELCWEKEQANLVSVYERIKK